MPRSPFSLPRLGFFLAGVVAGAVVRSRKREAETERTVEQLKQTVAALEVRLASQESLVAGQLQSIEAHTAKLNAIPSTGEIVEAMESLLAKTLSGLDQRLGAQANSIEVLQTAVSQTDGLLEKVLESLDLLQASSEHPAVAS
jgi:hypothetical protein